jgi:hypothetical protein
MIAPFNPHAEDRVSPPAPADAPVSPPALAAVGLLGPRIDHVQSLGAMLGPRFGPLPWLPDSLRYREAQGTPAPPRLRRLADQVWGTGDPRYVDHVTRAIDESEARVVIGYWGTMPLPDLAAIKKARPGVRIVLMVLCYPLALTATGIQRQNFFMRRLARCLDGIIYPPGEMEGYFRDRVLGRHAPPSVTLPPCWPAAYQAADRVPPEGHAPNLVYVGRTDLSARTIHPADDVRPLMKEILDAGIDLHHGQSPETDDGHPHRKPFRPVSLAQLIEKMGAYDASLMVYNAGACPRGDRFQLTVPDRLMTGVTAGIPVAIPRKGYEASKAYLKEYPAVIEFDSAGELKEALSDRPHIQRLRDAAWDARRSYTAERHGPALQRFLEGLL